MKETGRCTGLCCRHFHVGDPPMTPEDLAENARATREGEPFDRNNHRIYPDIEKVASMVIPLGLFKHNPVNHEEFRDWVCLYTCRHLKDNKDCGIYEERPHMCRSYPDFGICVYANCGCTYQLEREA